MPASANAAVFSFSEGLHPASVAPGLSAASGEDPPLSLKDSFTSLQLHQHSGQHVDHHSCRLVTDDSLQTRHKGRFVVAARAIKHGEVLFREQSLAFSLLGFGGRAMHRHCSWCLTTCRLRWKDVISVGGGVPAGHSSPDGDHNLQEPELDWVDAGTSEANKPPPLGSCAAGDLHSKSPKNHVSAPGAKQEGAKSPKNHVPAPVVLPKAGGPLLPAWKPCPRCLLCGYCSRECQKAHWRRHKSVCGTLRTIMQDGEGGKEEALQDAELMSALEALLPEGAGSRPRGELESPKFSGRCPKILVPNVTQFWELSCGEPNNVHPKNANPKLALTAYTQRFRCNNFLVVDDNMGGIAAVVLPHVAMLNHCCRPNVFLRYSRKSSSSGSASATFVCAVVAARDIEPGEEICHSYTDPGLPDHQLHLAEVYGSFPCGCSPPAGLGLSSQRTGVSRRTTDQFPTAESVFEAWRTVERNVQFGQLFAHLGDICSSGGGVGREGTVDVKEQLLTARAKFLEWAKKGKHLPKNCGPLGAAALELCSAWPEPEIGRSSSISRTEKTFLSDLARAASPAVLELAGVRSILLGELETFLRKVLELLWGAAPFEDRGTRAGDKMSLDERKNKILSLLLTGTEVEEAGGRKQPTLQPELLHIGFQEALARALEDRSASADFAHCALLSEQLIKVYEEIYPSYVPIIAMQRQFLGECYAATGSVEAAVKELRGASEVLQFWLSEYANGFSAICTVWE